MNANRYVVVSTSGYAVSPDMHSLDIDGKRGTEWLVLDAAWAYNIVASFTGRGKGMIAEVKARKLAWRLNLLERRWESTGE